METKEVNVTYETLFELLKREKDMSDLQKLEPNFFNYFVDYLNEKKNMLDKKDSLFSNDERKNVENQINNAKRMIKEIYDRREKKILIWLALQKSKTKSHVMDTSSLLENEKRLFNEIVKVLDSFRKDIIDKILDGMYPSEVTIEKKETLANDASNPISGNESNKSEERTSKLVRFLYSVPKFVGKELEEYGPFEEEDIANLPAEIAKVLLDKGRVEEIKGD